MTDETAAPAQTAPAPRAATNTVRDTDVRSGPDRYVSELGVARKLDWYLEEYARPVIITGVKSARAYLDHVGRAGEGDAGFHAPVLRYDGTATERNADELAAKARALRADVVVGIGGGKLADTTKNVAERLGSHLVLVPTLAATCAGYSALSVNYDDRHRYTSAPMHRHNSDLVLVDAELVATGPREYLVGGIGDTLAKWYESVPVFARVAASRPLSTFEMLAQRSAALIRDVLFAHAEPALDALDRGIIDEHLRQVVDAIIGLGGTVGGFGGVNARSSGAHCIHDSLTRLPESAQVVHGSKVAYGIIVQLIAEGKEDEARDLLPFYRAVGLPWSFARMGLRPSDAAFREVGEFAKGMGDFDRAVPGITADGIVDAMRRAEAL